MGVIGVTAVIVGVSTDTASPSGCGDVHPAGGPLAPVVTLSGMDERVAACPREPRKSLGSAPIASPTAVARSQVARRGHVAASRRAQGASLAVGIAGVVTLAFDCCWPRVDHRSASLPVGLIGAPPGVGPNGKHVRERPNSTTAEFRVDMI